MASSTARRRRIDLSSTTPTRRTPHKCTVSKSFCSNHKKLLRHQHQSRAPHQWSLRPQYQYTPYPVQPVQLTTRIQSRIDASRSRVDSLQSRMAQGMTNMRSNIRNIMNQIIDYYRGFFGRLDRKAKSRSGNSTSEDVALILTLSSLVIGAVLS